MANTRWRKLKEDPEALAAFNTKRREYHKLRSADPEFAEKRRVQYRKRYQEDPEFRKAVRERAQARDQERMSKDPEYRKRKCESVKRSYHRKKQDFAWRKANSRRISCLQHGITVADYHRMFEAQDGKCAICSQPETEKRQGFPKDLSIDHCHDSGEVRGLLCSACNKALGGFKDNPTNLWNAFDYLVNRKPKLRIVS